MLQFADQYSAWEEHRMKRKLHKPIKPSPHVEALKAFKPPPWSRWLGSYRAWRRARSARNETELVAVVTLWSMHYRSGEIYPSWLYCYQKKNKHWVHFQQGVYSSGYKDTFVWNQYVNVWIHKKLSTQALLRFAEHSRKVPTKDQFRS